MKNSIALIISGLLLVMVPAVSLLAQDEGDTAPDFTFTALDGNSISLSDYSGKVVFLFLFGNSCPACKVIGNDTETRVNEVYGPDENFQALGLDLWNSSSSAATVSGFQYHTGITYPLLLQAGDITNTYSTTYDRVIVIDPQGYIAHKGKEPTSGDLNNAIAVIDSLMILLNTDLVPEHNMYFGDLYPNPSREYSTMSYRLDAPVHLRAGLFNITGQRIKILSDRWQASGDQRLHIDTSELDEGIYFLNIESGQRKITRKLAVIR